MAYLKFLKTTNYLPCVVNPLGENVVNLKFDEPQEVCLNGFKLYLDAEGEFDIGGNSYKKFKTLYRSISENEYQLSNDGSVYVEPVIPEPEPIPEPTPEEKEEEERRQKIAELQAELASKEQELADTDYIIIKLYEYSLVGETTDEYDINELHEKRQAIRDEINAISEQIAILIAEGEEDNE